MTDVVRCPRCGAGLPASSPEQPCPACLMKLGLESWAGRQHQGSDPAHTPTKLFSAGFEAPSIEELAPLFPHLELLELIGQGGMGAVYKARQKTLDRLVAVKIIHPQAAGDPGFAERFAREARALARLNHPNIITIHDFGTVTMPGAGEEGESPAALCYFVMEHVDGTNLRQLLRSRQLTPQQALQIIPPLCDALQYAHDEGIVHRDIKPENILFTRGRVKIADFGLAKLLGRGPKDVTLTGAHQAMGTLHYMAPEQMERPLEVDHRADIYALGVTLYEMLTGELPIGRFAPPSQKVEVDVRLDEIVLRALEKEPGRRYQHASDVKTDVEGLSGRIQSTPGKPPPAGPDVLRVVESPAWGLLITGILSWVAIPFAFAVPFVMQPKPAGLVNLLLSLGLAPLVVGTAMVLGGLGMKRLEGYGLAVTAAVLPMIVLALKLVGIAFGTLVIGPADLVGAPMGLWALAVLTRSDVRAAFRTAAAGGRSVAVEARTPRDALRRRLRVPAIGLIVVGAVNLLVVGLYALGSLAQWEEEGLDRVLQEVWALGPGILSGMALSVPIGALSILAGTRMLRLRSYRLAETASVLVMLPVALTVVLGLPVGIWALVALSQRGVREAFADGAPDR